MYLCVCAEKCKKVPLTDVACAFRRARQVAGSGMRFVLALLHGNAPEAELRGARLRLPARAPRGPFSLVYDVVLCLLLHPYGLPAAACCDAMPAPPREPRLWHVPRLS